jgi:hypothetical protein
MKKIQTLVAAISLLVGSVANSGGFVWRTSPSSKTSGHSRTCPDGTVVKGNKPCPVTPPPTPDPTPTPPPVVGDVTSPNGLTGETAIADNFSTNFIVAGPAAATDVDDKGAFRFTCFGGHLSRNDPMVYPGQTGASHLHQFFGNTLTDANSTYTSLRTTGGSTCTRTTTESPQRTAYWMPAVLDGVGNAVKADWMNTYYKQIPNGNTACTAAPDATHLGYCIPLPNGLRFIFGYNMATGVGGPNTTDQSPGSDYWRMGFDCIKTDGTGESYTGTKHTMAAVVADGRCPTGAWLRIFLTFPECWDGVHIDVVNHRSHIVYADGAGILNERACPVDHPYKIPEIAISAHFTTDANFNAGKWHLSSDEMLPGWTLGQASTVPAGTSLHMDYWEAWGPVKATWQTNCINGHQSCSAGQLGNNTQISGMQQTQDSIPRHILVPLSSL